MDLGGRPEKVKLIFSIGHVERQFSTSKHEDVCLIVPLGEQFRLPMSGYRRPVRDVLDQISGQIGYRGPPRR